MKKILITALAAAFAMGAAAPVIAGEVGIYISHAGLDLTDPADVAVMEQRIESAVTTACAEVGDSHARAECVSDGKARAMAELSHRMRLAAAYTNAR